MNFTENIGDSEWGDLKHRTMWGILNLSLIYGFFYLAVKWFGDGRTPYQGNKLNIICFMIVCFITIGFCFYKMSKTRRDEK